MPPSPQRRLSPCAATPSPPSGRDDEIQKLVGPATQVIDLAGQLAVPGFIEGHGHFTGIGENQARTSI